ncbi:MAG: hypothetical protein ACRDDY_04105 [Clostridium sp.]|uniref:hypothetical protein n=1 Tax=Clostridium sp. TaxID=1506 RepID=UPI003EE7EEB5
MSAKLKEAKGLSIIGDTTNEKAMEMIKRFKAIKFVDSVGGVSHEQVAEFYGVGVDSIQTGIWKRKQEILEELGSRKYTHSELKSSWQDANAKINSQGMVLHSAKSVLFVAFQLTESEIAKQIVKEVLSIALGEKEQIIKPSYKELSPMQLLADNSKCMMDVFNTIGLNIPKELVLATTINETSKMIDYDFNEIKKVISKVDEEEYHTASSIAKSFDIKRNKTNESFILLGLQTRGTTSMQKFVLTELGKKYGVERPFSNGGHTGYQITWKLDSTTKYIDENITMLPTEYFNK